MLQGSGLLVEVVLPRVAVPVASALLVTVLWWLTGWSWFDVGVWPWALGALPVATLLAVRLFAAHAAHDRARAAVTDAVAALRSAGEALVAADASPGPALGALRLLRHRFAPGALLADLQAVLAPDALAAVRSARDPQAALLAELDRAVRAAGVDPAPAAQARAAIARMQAVGGASSLLAVAGELALVFLATLPVGLVTTTGNLTFLAVGGVALAFATLDAVASELERPAGGGPAWSGVEGAILAAERDLAPRPADAPADGAASA
jgi:predicted membrane chloride channel (bestrophin family)